MKMNETYFCQVTRLEAERADWEQRYKEEAALRQVAVDAASIPKDTRIAELEASGAAAEAILAEARDETIQQAAEAEQAQRKITELELKIKSLESALADRNAYIKKQMKQAKEAENVLSIPIQDSSLTSPILASNMGIQTKQRSNTATPVSYQYAPISPSPARHGAISPAPVRHGDMGPPPSRHGTTSPTRHGAISPAPARQGTISPAPAPHGTISPARHASQDSAPARHAQITEFFEGISNSMSSTGRPGAGRVGIRSLTPTREQMGGARGGLRRDSAPGGYQADLQGKT